MKHVLLIVDPQNDFITGTLAVAGAKGKMMKLADYLISKKDDFVMNPKYDYIYITMDSHPKSHCSFKENGGIWPTHCVYNTNGWNIPEYLEEACQIHGNVSYYHKGTEFDQEEYSIFDNVDDGLVLENQIKNLSRDTVYVDVCGITGDYCVLETIKGLRRLIGDNYINVLTQYTASIDGGEKLINYLKENNINYE